MMWKRRNQAADKPLLEALEPRLLLAADWTVMMCLDADNNLEPAGSTPEVNIVGQFDRTAGYESSNADWTETPPPEETTGFEIINSPPTPPAGVEATIVSVLPQSAVMLSEVPTSTWTYGCSATSAGMIFGYYDRSGYPDMYTGPANGGLAPLTDLGQGDIPLNPIPGSSSIIATQNGFDGRVTRGHVDDYWVLYGIGGVDPWEGSWPEHTWGDCTADYMGTNQWKWDWNGDGTRDANSDGGTSLYTNTSGAPLYDYIPSAALGLPQTALSHGMRLFAESRGYTVIENYTQVIDTVYPGGYSFADYRADIDAGRPVMIQVVGHSMVGVGYEAASQTIYLHDTWDNNVHSMIWGGSYAGMAQRAMTAIELAIVIVPVPEISVLDGTTVINDGEVIPIDFGSALSSTAPISRTFIIRNEGTGDLSLGAITAPAGFTLQPPAWTTLAPGMSVPFMLTLDTAAPGVFGGDVTIVNNDSDENPFNFAVSGEVRASGEITVLYGGSVIADGETVPLDFGQVAQYDATVEHVFTIRNDGPDVLAIATVKVPAGYTVTQPGNTLLAPGETTTFGVTLDSDIMGVHAGEVTFPNSDQDETPFNFAITGTVRGPDLAVADVKYTPGFYATGKDPISLNTSLSNVGMMAFPESGPVQIQARLSTDTIWGNADDLIVYQGDHHLLDLAVGEQSRWYGQTLRTSFGGPPTGSYYVAVKVNSDSGLDEMDLNNNVWWSAAADVELYPSNLYTRMTHASKVTFEDDAGQRVTVSFSGPGYADIRTTNGLTQRYMSGDIQRIVFGGTTEKSQLKIATRGDGTTVGDIVARGPLKAITGKGVTLTGDIEIAGSISKIVLGDVAEEHTISIGAPAPGNTKATVTLLFGSVEETTIISATPINSLTVTEWLDEDGTPDLIQAPWIGKLTIKGNRRSGVLGHFQADLLLDGAGAGKATLGAVKIAGDLRQADWDITGNMGKLTVIGTVADSTVRTTGGMAGITLGAADGTDFLAGIKHTVARYASDSADFDSVSASIGSLKIKGLKDRGATRWYFQNSNLSAAKIGKVDLLNVDFDNAGTRFGVHALRAPLGGGIRSVRYADTVTGEKWSWPIGDDLVTAIPDLEIVLL